MAITSVTVGDLVDSVAFHLTNTQATTSGSEFEKEIKKHLGWTMEALLRKSYMPAFRTDAQLTLVDGTSDYALPDDFEAIVEPSLYYDASPRETLCYYEEQDRIAHEWQERLSTEAKPTHYTIRDRDASTGLFQARFIPTPDTTYTVNYSYFAMPAAIQDTTLDDADLDPRFPRNMIDGLVKGTCLCFPQYLSTDQQIAYEKKYRETQADIRRRQDPVEGYARQNSPYPASRPGYNRQRSWNRSIYSGSPPW